MSKEEKKTPVKAIAKAEVAVKPVKPVNMFLLNTFLPNTFLQFMF